MDSAAPTKSLLERRLKLAPDDTKIDFLGRRKICAMISAALIVISMAALALAGLNFGIDFRGGTLVQARFAQTADLGAVRAEMSGLGLGEVAVQEFGEATDVMIRVETQPEPEEGETPVDVVAKVTEALNAAFGADGVSVVRAETVGPKVSGELIFKGIQAITLAVLAVLVYVWLRFEWQYSVGAVAALMHDVALTIGVFAVLQIEFTLAIIAAILTIVGYSLNDTVVVFDRVRENMRRYKTTPEEQVLNFSINETLSRTLMTSVTTLLALFALYLLGGPVLQGFTLAMIIGVVIGTYSSVFIAAPVLLALGVPRGEESDDNAGPGVKFGDGAQP